MSRGTLLVLVTLLLTAPAASAAAPATGDAAVREFLRAAYTNDVKAFDRVVVAQPGSHRLLNTSPIGDEERKAIEEEIATTRLQLVGPYEFAGAPARPKDGVYPDGTVGRFLASFRGNPMIVTVVVADGGWKVDLRWWMKMIEMAQRDDLAKEDPEYAIKSMLLAMLQLDRSASKGWIVSPDDVDRLFAGAPSSPDPSDVLVSLVYDMPVVAARPGETVRMPSGRIVTADASGDPALFLGLFGKVQMPFVLRKVRGAWKVEAEPYFAIMNR